MSGNSWLWILFPGRCGRLGPSWGVGATEDDANAGVTGQGCGEVGATPAPSRRQPGTHKYVGVEAMHPLTGLNVHKVVVHTQVCAQVHAWGRICTRVCTQASYRCTSHTYGGVGAHTGTGTCVGTSEHTGGSHTCDKRVQLCTGAGTRTGTGEHTGGAHLCYRYTRRCAGTWMRSTRLCVHTGSHPLGGYNAPWQHPRGPGIPQAPKTPGQHCRLSSHTSGSCWFNPKTQFTLPFERPQWSSKSWGCEEGV